MRPPRQIPQRPDLSAQERAELAAKARYDGSPEHKNLRWWGGLPQGGRPRPYKQKTTICPLVTEDERNLAEEWVQKAISRGDFRFSEGDKDFPKHIWYCADGKGWFGLCINSASGSYKGWPMDEDEYLAYCS